MKKKKKEEKKKKDTVIVDDTFDESDIIGKDSKAGKKRFHSGDEKNVNLKCPLCESGIKVVVYKDVYQLKKFTSVRGRIISSERSGVCSKHQRQLAQAVKRARYLALLPYVSIDS